MYFYEGTSYMFYSSELYSCIRKCGVYRIHGFAYNMSRVYSCIYIIVIKTSTFVNVWDCKKYRVMYFIANYNISVENGGRGLYAPVCSKITQNKRSCKMFVEYWCGPWDHRTECKPPADEFWLWIRYNRQRTETLCRLKSNWETTCCTSVLRM